MKKLSVPFLIVLFVAGALVHKGLAKKGSFISTDPVLIQSNTVENSAIFENNQKAAFNSDHPSFSIHKIINSAMYYELHIQRDTVLETWKIYKGPSCNPLHARKAIRKENFPLDYLLFEGTLSKEKVYKEGVLVWDYGTYIFQNPPTVDCYEIIFQGKRMQGLYILEKRSNEWILTKQADEFADFHKNITRLFTRSALSGLTLTQILHGLKPK